MKASFLNYSAERGVKSSKVAGSFRARSAARRPFDPASAAWLLSGEVLGAVH
ncbi:hypothetical protein ABIE89_002822 [Bradyrhizobium niftali]|uniref:hypothetical protein n=1 Tax=Bradyrhizobium niftali TaxID=2560055 RepID=UPI00040542EC